ncbi:MAG: IPT/TIG domain-containing protein [Chloroflexi bacterium]|nr:IPT/TIG domain-containing protein [Chloroflexota bacterium]
MAQLSAAGTVTVTTRAPAPGEFVSNGLPFAVLALPPVISQVSPTSILAGTPQATLTITGTNFSADAQLLWDGAALPTVFVNSGKLSAQVAASLLVEGKTVGLAVRNRTPQESVSPPVAFEVVPSNAIFLPLMTR